MEYGRLTRGRTRGKTAAEKEELHRQIEEENRQQEQARRAVVRVKGREAKEKADRRYAEWLLRRERQSELAAEEQRQRDEERRYAAELRVRMSQEREKAHEQRRQRERLEKERERKYGVAHFAEAKRIAVGKVQRMPVMLCNGVVVSRTSKGTHAPRSSRYCHDARRRPTSVSNGEQGISDPLLPYCLYG